jgi:hypothetical protein
MMWWMSSSELPLSDKPDGTTTRIQVTNTCLAAGERPKKTATFISGVHDACTFMVWLRASCPGSLTAQLKRMSWLSRQPPMISEPWSAHCGPSEGGCEFPHLHAPGGPLCTASGKKTLGRGMPESIARKELESMDIRIQGVAQLRSSLRDQDPARDHHPTPISLYR